MGETVEKKFIVVIVTIMTMLFNSSIVIIGTTII